MQYKNGTPAARARAGAEKAFRPHDPKEKFSLALRLEETVRQAKLNNMHRLRALRLTREAQLAASAK